MCVFGGVGGCVCVWGWVCVVVCVCVCGVCGSVQLGRSVEAGESFDSLDGPVESRISEASRVPTRIFCPSYLFDYPRVILLMGAGFRLARRRARI